MIEMEHQEECLCDGRLVDRFRIDPSGFHRRIQGQSASIPQPNPRSTTDEDTDRNPTVRKRPSSSQRQFYPRQCRPRSRVVISRRVASLLGHLRGEDGQGDQLGFRLSRCTG